MKKICKHVWVKWQSRDTDSKDEDIYIEGDLCRLCGVTRVVRIDNRLDCEKESLYRNGKA